MKAPLYVAWLTLSLGLCAQESSDSNPAARRAGDDAFAGPIGPHHRVHTWTTQDAAGREMPHRVVAIASGMHYWNGEAYLPSDARFIVTPEAFAAERVGHRVWLQANLNVAGAVTVAEPSGQVLRSTPVAIGLYDAASGAATIIGAIQDCEGVQVSDTEVVYENAFQGDGVLADVVYTITQGTFEQDVVIRSRLDPAAYGFPTNTTRIQVFTEFYDPPRPEKLRRPLRVEEDETVRRRMVSPDVVDEVLTFGELTFWTGKAYTAAPGAQERGGVPLAKQWMAGERTFLVESLEYQWMEEELEALPQVGPVEAAARKKIGASQPRYAALPRPPSRAEARPATPRRPGLLAQAEPRTQRGVILDYRATLSTSSTPLRSDTTYFVAAPVSFNSLTLEGGAVLKFKHSTTAPVGDAWVKVNGALTCKTSANRPAIFTAEDDDSAGDCLLNFEGSGHTHPGGVPRAILPGGYANPALWTYYLGSPTLSHVRIRHAKDALRIEGAMGSWVTVAHSELADCIRGVVLVGGAGGGCGCGVNVTINNSLFAQVQQVLTGNAASGCYAAGYLNNCTVDGGPGSVLATHASGYGSTFNFKDSVLANLDLAKPGADGQPPPAQPAISGTYNGFYNAGVGRQNGGGFPFGTQQRLAQPFPSSPFLAGPAGAFYLNPDPSKYQGTSFIDSGSQQANQAGLFHFTTSIDNVKEQRSTVDLGYHYVANGSASGFPDDTVWIEDEVGFPASATTVNWLWVDNFTDSAQNRIAFWGRKCHKGSTSAEHSFEVSAPGDKRLVPPGSALFTYVYLSAGVTELTVGWQDDQTGVTHKAYWQAASDPGRPNDLYMGGLPTSGQWARIEVAARQLGSPPLGLENATLKGMTFKASSTGTAWWDRSGIASACALDSDNDGRPDHIEDANGNGVKDSAESDWRVRATNLWNLNFGGGTKTGAAAVGYGTADQWFTYTSLSGATVYPTSSDGTQSDIAVSVVGRRADGTPANLRTGSMTYGDTMYATYLATHSPSLAVKMELTIRNLPPGTYCLYLYGHGPNDADISTFSVKTIGPDENGQETDTGTYDFLGIDPPDTIPAANSTTATDLQWETAPFAANRHYLLYTVMVRTNERVKITLQRGGGPNFLPVFLNGLQIGRLTRGLYISSQETLVLDDQRTKDLLEYARMNQFNYLAIFGAGDKSAAARAAFITEARTKYGVLQIGAKIHSKTVDFTPAALVDYNDNLQPQARFDVLNLEMTHAYYSDCQLAEPDSTTEFWNIKRCSRHLSPSDWQSFADGGCKNFDQRASAFDGDDAFLGLLKDMRAKADGDNLLVEAYLGFPTGKRTLSDGELDPVTEWRAVLKRADRLLLHAYDDDGPQFPDDPAHTDAYEKLNEEDRYEVPPARYRMTDFREAHAQVLYYGFRSRPTMVWPIFSAEGVYMGGYLGASTPDAADGATKLRYWSGRGGPDTWEDGYLFQGNTYLLTLDGFMYFKSNLILLP